MICLIHGYLLDGSGSNLWTRSIVQSLCRQGETVHLVCQEYHPEHYDFISAAYRYHAGGERETLFDRSVPYAGRAIMHKPQIGETLPVYVWDRYEEFSRAVPMVELADDAINHYLDRNAEVLARVVREHGVSVMHVNHAVLMSVVAERVGRAARVPFAIMPHGSDIEYAIKKDERFLRLAEGALRAAGRVFVIGREMRERAGRVFAAVPGLEEKMVGLNLGVDTSLFEPIGRDERRASVGELARSLAGLPRGKTREMSEALTSSLDGGDPSLEQLGRSIQAAEYDAKRPDADLEAKLDAIDWDAARTLLFVGRIISSKGLQSIIAALPLILDRQPAARLIVAGHGPLREAMEVMLWALGRGDRRLVEKIVEWGSLLEGSADRKPLVTVRQFYEQLRERGELDDYFEKARRHLRPDSVVFTGYLTHKELQYLFPSADVAIFPSVVAEAGPLVFLEALASGCFPLGTYFAGMAASIDSVAAALPDGDAEVMKLSAEADRTVADIASKAPEAIRLAEKHKRALREVAVERYEWSSVARRLAAELRALESPPPFMPDK